MRIGGSLFLIALGAILRFAVTVRHSHGVNIATVGVILMIVGAIGLVVTAAWVLTRQRTDVIHHDGRTTLLEPTDRLDTY